MNREDPSKAIVAFESKLDILASFFPAFTHLLALASKIY